LKIYGMSGVKGNEAMCAVAHKKVFAVYSQAMRVSHVDLFFQEWVAQISDVDHLQYIQCAYTLHFGAQGYVGVVALYYHGVAGPHMLVGGNPLGRAGVSYVIYMHTHFRAYEKVVLVWIHSFDALSQKDF